jgi:D-alanyl-lipoteichoic acid acyltransferase DltB (MBOAT superfamily)
MLFNSVEYACLLVTVFAGFWLLHRHRRPRVLLLLAASYTFYACWNAKYLLLILLSSNVDFAVGRLLGLNSDPRRRKLLLATSVIVNLGVLCAFKYFNFFADSFAGMMSALGIETGAWHLNVLLPVGISFYTFQTLSYTIDVYRKQMEPAADYFEYLLFVSFFPQLVAGPIVRARHLLPQIGRLPSLTAERGSRALFLIGSGLIKKIAIADFLGTHMVDRVFSNPEMYSSVESLLGVYAYAFQIYADFSAYSDIAIGSAALLGFDIPINFNAPYRAANLREFWQRWHISLSTWLRDYLYLPLGGSRRGSGRTYLNLMVTMLLGGLWHGAAATFVAWGAMHGAALMLTRVVQRTRVLSRVPGRLRRVLGVVVTFHVVCAAWVFFRAPSFSVAVDVFRSIAALDLDTTNLGWPGALVLLAAALIHWFPTRWLESIRAGFHAIPAAIQALGLVGAMLAVRQLALTEVTPFIYFQF